MLGAGRPNKKIFMDRITTQCPFCNGDINGCCFCDHSGRIFVGKGYVFESVDDLKPFKKEFVTESDLRRLFDVGAFDNLKGKSG